MKVVKVALGKNSYEIRIGSGVLARVGDWLKVLGFAGRLVIITDTRVKGLYGEARIQMLENAGFQVALLSVPEGEEQKSLDVAGRLYQELTDARAERNTPILALGGGVIGDLAGFVAATYMRGVPLVQLPTTLLAQVDSSIGGKVAVDHGQLKNKIGVFYQPRLVIADIAALRTLPAPELSSGLAEVIKSAAIRDREFFGYLESNLARIKTLAEESLEEVVFRTAKIKAQVVARDERDTGLRNILNYGHTIGHAVESVSAFQIKHGSAVAIGMVTAAKISAKLGLLDDQEVSRLQRLLEQTGLPTDMPQLQVEALLQAMAHDKKVQQDKLRLVLLRSLGNAVIVDDVNPALVAEVLHGNK